MTYKDYIETLKAYWTGRKVSFEGKEYKVVGVDYNGALLLNKRSEHNETTAVGIEHLDH